MTSSIAKAREEINETLKYCNFCMRNLGIAFIDELPKSLSKKFMQNIWYCFATSMIICLCLGELAFVGGLLKDSNSVAAFVASLHIIGYGILSSFKLLMLWFKRSVFRKVVNELVELWPVSINDKEGDALKQRTLTALRFTQLCYMFWNKAGVLFYIITPFVSYFYKRIQGQPSELGFIWHATYPFDKTEPFAHACVFVFEICAGWVAVLGQLGSDLIFTTMASHISMLLRLLQIKIRGLGTLDKMQAKSAQSEEDVQQNSSNQGLIDCYDDIVSVVKIHQRLINYSEDLEDVFSIVNLINVLLSSVHICCVVFNIVLLESWMHISNKLFLGAVLTQVGIICWYADEIVVASMGVADEVYESGWYRTNPRCRRAFLVLLRRSQKPLSFTALKFRKITMTTYSSILTTAYSYFALLYTMYSN